VVTDGGRLAGTQRRLVRASIYGASENVRIGIPSSEIRHDKVCNFSFVAHLEGLEQEKTA
jgi:hypothetical protein